jgi:hypothetical protein
MGLTTAFRDFIADAVTGIGTPTLFDNTNAYIGVGDSATAFSSAQTDLQGTSKTRKGMEASFPDQSQGANVMRFKASFGTGDANYAWNEWGVFNASTAGTMMNRKVESLGTKTSAQTWEFTVDVQINLA